MNWCLTIALTLTTLCHITIATNWKYNQLEDNIGFSYRPWQARPPVPRKWRHHVALTKYSSESMESDSDEDSEEWGYGDGWRNNWKNPWYPPKRTTTTRPSKPVSSTLRTTPTSSTSVWMTTMPTSMITPSFTSWTLTSARTTPQPASTKTPFVTPCISSCPVTSEYNPVCGTNNITYTNPGRLDCARRCGVDVAVRAKSTCAVANANDKTNTGDSSAINTSTNVTPTWSFGRTPSLFDIMTCMQTCSLTSELNPVCGTDGITYSNPGRLLCAQFCGIDVRVQKMSACSSFPDNNGNIPTFPTTNAPTTANGGALSPAVQACIKFCPQGSENNPVCGTDNVTYTNIGRLMCVKRCGLDVSVRKLSACTTSSPIDNGNIFIFPTTNAPNEGSFSSVIQACINSCPRVSENNPVCGTDNITYNNIGRLMCVKRCGVDVSVQSMTACPNSNGNTPAPATTKAPNVNTNGTSQICISSCPVTPEYNPVCGTNNVTYDNIGRLNCAKTCGINVDVRRLSRCPTNNNGGDETTPLIPKKEVTPTTESTSDATDGFTIPQDILDMVFNFSTTMSPQMTTSEESEEFDIDHRFNTQ